MQYFGVGGFFSPVFLNCDVGRRQRRPALVRGPFRHKQGPIELLSCHKEACDWGSIVNHGDYRPYVKDARNAKHNQTSKLGHFFYDCSNKTQLYFDSLLIFTHCKLRLKVGVEKNLIWALQVGGSQFWDISKAI